MKSILVPVDFSECSIDALKFAAKAAKASGAKINLISIIEKQNYYFLGSDPIAISPELIESNNMHDEQLKKEIRLKLEKLKMSAFLKGINVECKVGTCLKVYKCIIEYSRISGSDFIIMGSNGAHGLSKVLIGSNSERVARFSNIPVLIINGKINKLETVIFASDFDKESYKVFPFIKSFAECFKADIHLLKVNIYSHYNNSEDSELLKKFNKKYNTNYKEVIQNSPVISLGIQRYSSKIRNGIIAIGTHGKKGLIRLLLENISEETIRSSVKPVLTVNLK
ncbi:MAG TPA: universal stress protein [Ignavibacteria bacterium]|nr:universal stress protein [Ignavibacteria bacterium]